MTVSEKVKENELFVKKLLDELRTKLNNERLEYEKEPNNWKYLTTLSHTRSKLEDLLGYFENPKF